VLSPREGMAGVHVTLTEKVTLDSLALFSQARCLDVPPGSTISSVSNSRWFRNVLAASLYVSAPGPVEYLGHDGSIGSGKGPPPVFQGPGDRTGAAEGHHHDP
jgi:hypothetical protein